MVAAASCGEADALGVAGAGVCSIGVDGVVVAATTCEAADALGVAGAGVSKATPLTAFSFLLD